jgi:hypothetical protein
MNGITRRAFIKVWAAAGVSTRVPFSRVRGANEDLRLAVIGREERKFNVRNEKVEIFAFMSAADQSKKEGGKPVLLDTVLQEAETKK